MADLTKAMQTAAEAARADTLERFSAEAKAHIESIHASTADEATELRKKADDDIAGIREWSKNEIARIREETDERIAHRKDVLEREIEAHAAEIEERIERVQSRVTAFEGEMADFFERLLAEDDPTRFAAMAETLPEPPPFDDESRGDRLVGVHDRRSAGRAETEPASDSWGEPDRIRGHERSRDHDRGHPDRRGRRGVDRLGARDPGCRGRRRGRRRGPRRSGPWPRSASPRHRGRADADAPRVRHRGHR